MSLNNSLCWTKISYNLFFEFATEKSLVIVFEKLKALSLHIYLVKFNIFRKCIQFFENHGADFSGV